MAMATLAAASDIHAADVTGKWTSAFESAIGPLQYTYEFTATGDKLTGKAIRTREGEKTEAELKEGKLVGDEISFVEPLNYQGQDIRIEYQGKLSGDEIKFTRKVADFSTLEIVAKREKVSAVIVTGKWQAEFDTQIGKQKYLYDLKADGARLTGKAVGDIVGEKSDTEIQAGKVSGSDISFVEMVNFQGQEIRVDYKGKVEGDEIKFTRQVGDVATEQLVAKRVKEATAK
jgi:hypothetical protein